jgi:hypothetical protein
MKQTGVPMTKRTSDPCNQPDVSFRAAMEGDIDEDNLSDEEEED